MLAPMDLEQKPKIPISIVGAQVVEAPQNLFQIIGDIQNVIDCVADGRLARYVYSKDSAIQAKIRKSRGNILVGRINFGRRFSLTLGWFASGCVVIAERQLVQTPSKPFLIWDGADRGEINEALSSEKICRDHTIT